MVNRLFFIEWIKYGILCLVCVNKGIYYVLFYLDFDCFKSINDLFGYEVGDYFLVKICEFI